MDLVPPSDHHVLVFLVSFAVLLVAARGLGAIAQRIGQPSVVGELSAGLLLGPSVLGRIAPDVEEWLFPADDVQTAMIFTVAWLGVIFLLLTTGFETDLGLIRRLGSAAGVVSTGSLLVPIAGGLAVGATMPDLFLGSADRTSFALFMGAALSISSLPVIAKILSDMGYMRRDFGQLTLAAAMANDVVGWIILGVIAGLVSAGTISASDVVLTLLGVAGFFALAFTLGQRIIDGAFRSLRRNDATTVNRTTVLVAITLIASVATQWLGVEAVLGAFVAGILVGRSPYRDASLLESVETASVAFLAPIFFATAGLRVDLGLLSDPTVALWGLVVLAVASLTKFVGSLLGGTIAGLPGRESTALGIALNARGALEIVIASVGLTLGVLNQASYTVVVLMAMATSMMAPPLLTWALRGWQGTAREQERLQREETLAANLVVRGERVLLPSRGGPASMLAAQVLDLAWPTEAAVTVLTVGTATDPEAIRPVTGLFHDRPAAEQHQPDEADLATALCAEAKLGYGAIVLGIGPDHGDAVPAWVAQVIAGTTIPVVIVRGPALHDRRTPWAFGRALLPVAGGPSATASLEIAVGISASLGTETVLAHIAAPERAGTGPREAVSRLVAGLLQHASTRAISAGARVQTIERTASSPVDEILSLVHEVGADLVIVGATRKAVGGELFLGHTTSEVLTHAEATVIAVVLPSSKG